MPKFAFEKVSWNGLFSDFISKIETSILNYLADASNRDISQIKDLSLLS